MKAPVTIFFFLMLLNITSYGRQPSRVLDSKPTEATLYFNGAELTRQASVSYGAGNSELVFSTSSPYIDPSGIQVKGVGDFTILSVSFRTNYLESPELNERQREMADSIEFLERAIAHSQVMQKALGEEQQMLLANKTIGGTETGVQVSELEAAVVFFRGRLTDIKLQILELEQQIEKDKERLNRLKRQLGLLEDAYREPVGQIVVNISANRPGRGDFTIRYFINEAGWNPEYDIRVKDTETPVEINLKASVFQNTGEDWDDVMLTFSTGNPRQPGQKPQLSPWWLDFVSDERLRLDAPPVVEAEAYEEFIVVEDDLELAMIQKSEALVNMEYAMNMEFSLSSGGNRQQVELVKESIPAIYEYYAVPKIYPAAFLVARLPDWEQYSLMSAPASLFLEGTFLGKTWIDPVASQDTLELSLGKDDNIIVSRQRVKDFSKRSFFGNKITETVGWQINVRNNKQVPVVINVREQVPVSVNDQLEVNIEEASGATIDSEKGFLNWNFKLEPREAQELNFRYSVRYPEDRQVILE